MSEIVYVCMPPDGEPKPCLADQLGYALSLGYKPCDPPQAKPVVEVIAPETTSRPAPTIASEVVTPDVTPRRRRGPRA